MLKALSESLSRRPWHRKSSAPRPASRITGVFTLSLLVTWILIVLPQTADAQVVGSTSVSVQNPLNLYTQVSVTAANEAGSPTNPDCDVDPAPTECTNNEAFVRIPIVRRLTASVPTRRGDLAVTKVSEDDAAVPGDTITYTITVENLPQDNFERLFISRASNIFELDPVDGTVLNLFPSPVFFSRNGGLGMASTESTLLVGGDRQDSIYEIDPDTGETLREIPNPGISIGGLALRDGEIFAVTDDPSPANSRVIVIDYETGEFRRALGNFSEELRVLDPGLAAAPNDLVGMDDSGPSVDLFEIDPLDQRAGFSVLFQAGDGQDPEGLGSIGGELFLGSDSSVQVYPFGVTTPSRVFTVTTDPNAVGGDQFQIRHDAVAATVTDIFPPELSCTWTCLGTGGASCTAGPALGDINDSVDIPVGESVTYTAECAIPSSALGTLTNTAAVDGSSSLIELDDGDNSATVIDSLTALSDLSITKTDDRDPIGAGATLTYTITVDNAGPSDATSVIVTESLPAEVTLISTSGCNNDPLGAPSCELGTIVAGGSASFDVEVLVDAEASASPLVNTVSVTSASGDLVAANNEAVEETTLDATAPTITNLNSFADTGDGQLEDCEEARVSITQLEVSFSKPVFDPPGDADPADVTNPANYLLVGAGPDGDFATAACGPVAGDDEQVTVDAVAYDAQKQAATLAINASTPLGDSLYRFIVCGSPGIEDLAGNVLDGDADGTGGGDFVRTYRVETDNLFVNGQFDCDLDPWVAVSDDANEITYNPDDVQDSSVSGSVALTNLTAGTGFSLGQCPDVDGGGIYAITGSVRVEADPDAVLLLVRSCEFYSQVACAGTSLTTALDFGTLSDTGGEWTPRSAETRSPLEARSALCSFEVRAPGGDDFDIFFDDLRLSLAPLFADGFESGNTEAWSGSFP